MGQTVKETRAHQWCAQPTVCEVAYLYNHGSREEHRGARRQSRPVYYARDHAREARPFGENQRRWTEREERPRPIGDRCNAACPLFRCGKRALMVRLVDGKPSPWCTWVNDTCIGYRCQYASCHWKRLLPEGRCLAASEVKEQRREGDEFLRELEKVNVEDSTIKSLLHRRGLRKDLAD